ncbi:MAG: extracellular solute-binding protein [Sedimentisphaerales bacterium]|nr:extracellular solute-binding protein [Sedimentisphaerales bacterium]
MEEHNNGQLQIPLHRRIAENLGAQVSGGQLKPGQKLPSERQIARQFSASRATVRTALQHLEQAGLISRRERRSAVVTIRRDIAPYLRIGCSDSKLVNLFNRLSDMQILPPRCQIQLCDLHLPGAVTQLATQPTMGIDMLICSLEYVSCMIGKTDNALFPDSIVDENQLFSFPRSVAAETDSYLVIPLVISPLVLYYNRQMFNQRQIETPRHGKSWNDLAETAQALTHDRQYGLQFRPSFDHLAAIVAGHGATLYAEDGRVAAQTPAFEAALRFTHSLLHTRRCSPLLAKADQINLFAEQRCAMAVDGFDMFNQYRDALGQNLGIAPLPQGSAPVLSGFAAVVQGDQKDLQPIRDLLRALLSANSQRMFAQMAAGLPVRSDLLSIEALQAMNISAESSQVFLNSLQQSRVSPLPLSAAHKANFEAIILEMWLGLDTIDSIANRMRNLN